MPRSIGRRACQAADGFAFSCRLNITDGVSRMSKLLRGSSSLLALIVAGCAKDRAPFDPREFQQDELRTADQIPAREKQPLPTTLQSPFIPATGPAATQPAPV